MDLGSHKMEGLIPYLYHAIKKQRPQRRHRSSFTESISTHASYHRLTSGHDVLEASSLRRTPPEVIRSRSFEEEGGASAAPPGHIESSKSSKLDLTS
ncbi:PREDICTED: LOC18768278 [Prunus dulcis]|uniref:PREDICTED: LOC18768278 n=1 Tax=Prunus dulcis TaxID=3755 RepID=A0A5E4FRG9_PRUDU|nr:hypothetical protein L3X38_044011 [Prunus dulcis]VVA30106.1 PREDICTED: LOC18768278 [Prunus dulcis]